MNQTIPHDVMIRDHRQIGYYQWVPFILVKIFFDFFKNKTEILQAVLAFFFYAPYMIWWVLNWSTGIDIHSIIKMARDKNDMGDEGHTKHVKIIAGYIRESLRSQRHIGSTNCGGWGCFAVFSHKGCLVTALLLFVKALYMINSICQILLMSAMLGETSVMYGLHVFMDLVRGVEWETTGNFPRVTLCDFETRVLGNVQRHTVQVWKLQKLPNSVELFHYFFRNFFRKS